MMAPMDLGLRGQADLHGVDFEEFVSTLCVACIGMGTADRQSLRERGYADAEIDLGTAELLARGFLVRTDQEDAWAVVPPRESFPQYLEAVEHRAALARASISELDNQWRRAVGREALASFPTLTCSAASRRSSNASWICIGRRRSACGGRWTPPW